MNLQQKLYGKQHPDTIIHSKQYTNYGTASKYQHLLDNDIKLKSVNRSRSEWVWTFNKPLPELSDNNGDIKDAISQYSKFIEQNHLLPLQTIFDEIYYDLNIPIDITKVIIIYKTGGIVYNYSKRFEEFTKNTIYITPIIFGYIETFIFALMCIVSNSRFYMLLVSSIYISVLTIHGICALISYHKCKKYEIIIRNFKHSLYSNPNFIDYVLQIENNKTISHTNINNWHWTSPYIEKRNIDKLLSTILNPTNNTLAFISFQRWINVKILELENDSFTRSKSALYLSLSKYFVPAYCILSITLVSYTTTTFSIVWNIIFLHSLYILMYCYLRVIENMPHSVSLGRCLQVAIVQDTILVASFISSIVHPSKSDTNHANKHTTKTMEIIGIVFCVFFSIICVFLLVDVIIMIVKIIKYNQHYTYSRDTTGAYRFWSFLFMFWGLFMVAVGFFFMAVMPEVDYIVYIIGFGLILMVITGYMVTQQIIHRVISGMDKIHYIKRFITKNPQSWLKYELKLLFIHYIQ